MLHQRPRLERGLLLWPAAAAAAAAATVAELELEQSFFSRMQLSKWLLFSLLPLPLVVVV